MTRSTNSLYCEDMKFTKLQPCRKLLILSYEKEVFNMCETMLVGT